MILLFIITWPFMGYLTFVLLSVHTMHSSGMPEQPYDEAKIMLGICLVLAPIMLICTLGLVGLPYLYKVSGIDRVLHKILISPERALKFINKRSKENK